MTNLGKTKEKIVYELVMSLNSDSKLNVEQIVNLAIEQYDVLVKKGIIKELDSENEDDNEDDDKDCHHNWQRIGESYYTCSKCGIIKIKNTEE